MISGDLDHLSQGVHKPAANGDDRYLNTMNNDICRLFIRVMFVLFLFVCLGLNGCSSPQKSAFVGKWQTEFNLHRRGWVYGMEVRPDGTCHLTTYWVETNSTFASKPPIDNGDTLWEMHGDVVTIGATGNTTPAIGRLEAGRLTISIPGEQTMVYHRVSDYDWMGR